MLVNLALKNHARATSHVSLKTQLVDVPVPEPFRTQCDTAQEDFT